MTSNLLDVHCKKCNAKFTLPAKTEKSFLGFQLHKCPQCYAKNEYPLTTGYQRFYQILFVLMIAAIIYIVSQGGIGLPGLIGICICWALIKDYNLRKQFKQ